MEDLYTEYVASTKNRDSKKTRQEVGLFTAFCDGAFQEKQRIKSELFSRMMECCTAYEEAGFIAGVKYAAQILEKGRMIFFMKDEDDSKDPVDPDHDIRKETDKKLGASSRKKKVNKDAFISTREIAKVFGAENWKIVERIKLRIIPVSDPVAQVGFKEYAETITPGRTINVYRLNYEACMAYLQAVEKSNSRNRAGMDKKIAGFRKLIQERFGVAEDEE